jgi:hypothetical protein
MREPENRIEEADAPALLEAASAHLSRRIGAAVRLTWQERIPDYAHVLRCSVEAPDSAALPATIILKIPQRASRLARLMNDAAGLDFLNRMADGTPRICPRFFGADPVGGFMLSEDLGSETLLTVLMADRTGARGVAEAALMSLACTLADVACSTRNQMAEYDSLRASYGEREPHMNFDCAGHLSRSYGEVIRCLASLDFHPPSEFGQDYADSCSPLTPPTPFFAYTNFDSSPNNTAWSRDAGRVRIFDFDHGTYRMALLDGACLRMMQTYPDVYALPADLAASLEAAYRARLLPAFPEAGDDSLWDRATATAHAFWTLYFVIGYLPPILSGSLGEDFLWPKRQILKVLREFGRADGALRSIRAVTERLEVALTARWGAIHGEEAVALRPFPALTAC